MPRDISDGSYVYSFSVLLFHMQAFYHLSYHNLFLLGSSVVWEFIVRRIKHGVGMNARRVVAFALCCTIFVFE